MFRRRFLCIRQVSAGCDVQLRGGSIDTVYTLLDMSSQLPPSVVALRAIRSRDWKRKVLSLRASVEQGKQKIRCCTSQKKHWHPVGRSKHPTVFPFSLRACWLDSVLELLRVPYFPATLHRSLEREQESSSFSPSENYPVGALYSNHNGLSPPQAWNLVWIHSFRPKPLKAFLKCTTQILDAFPFSALQFTAPPQHPNLCAFRRLWEVRSESFSLCPLVPQL